jgi:hypothetical protein
MPTDATRNAAQIPQIATTATPLQRDLCISAKFITPAASSINIQRTSAKCNKCNTREFALWHGQPCPCLPLQQDSSLRFRYKQAVALQLPPRIIGMANIQRQVTNDQ